ncbi:MAG: sensor histidine kinase [Bacteroidales bacterium]|nr:sensor histidine kinase [Bacteroidales bacterium]
MKSFKTNTHKKLSNFFFARIYIYISIILFISSIQITKVIGQEDYYIDSLIKHVCTLKDDTLKVQNYILIGQLYEYYDLDKAKSYYLKAKSLSEKLGYHRGVLQYYSNYTYLLNITGMYDSSLNLNLQAVAYANKHSDELYLGKSYINTGTSYRNLGDFINAIEYYHKGLKIFEKRGDDVINSQIYSILGAVYNDISRYDTALYYSKKAIEIAEPIGITKTLADSYSNLGNIYVNLNDLEQAEASLMQSLDLALLLNDELLLATLYLNIGNLKLQDKDFDEYNKYITLAYEKATKLNLKENEVVALKGLGIYHLYTKSYQEAENYALQALEIAQENQYLVEECYIYNLLADISYAKNDIEQALEYDKKAEECNDKVMNEIIQNSISDAKEKYETAKKDHQLYVQQVLLKEHEETILRLAIISVSLILVIIFVIVLYRQKRRIHLQKTKQLETEKQLKAREMLIRGEEEERRRLAKDLHDGLGGILSSLKYALGNLKDKLKQSRAKETDIDKCIDLVDSSISEMRNTAHSLMPDVLDKFGLDVALQNFCTDININSKSNISYQAFGLEEIDLSHQTKISVYRIIQELINNALKHASAKNINVQLTVIDQNLTITVEDDGKGFDSDKISDKKGIGLTNIENRLKLLNGSLDIQSETDQGSSFFIEINIK